VKVAAGGHEIPREQRFLIRCPRSFLGVDGDRDASPTPEWQIIDRTGGVYPRYAGELLERGVNDREARRSAAGRSGE